MSESPTDQLARIRRNLDRLEAHPDPLQWDSLIALCRKLLNLIDVASDVMASGEKARLVAAPVKCPYPAKGDPDGITAVECFEKGNCGCVYGKRRAPVQPNSEERK